jgi:hypothetical protein
VSVRALEPEKAFAHAAREALNAVVHYPAPRGFESAHQRVACGLALEALHLFDDLDGFDGVVQALELAYASGPVEWERLQP